MSSGNTITYLSNKEIDKQLWNGCIDKAPNGLIYAYSFYLDAMADNWDALVLNNYEAVMPLPWRKKYGIHYLYQPFLTAQLGLFGNAISAELLNSFFKTTPHKFKLWEFSLNHGNLFQMEGFHLYERTNYVLDLNHSYNNLYSNYRENVQRNIKKSFQYGCSIKTGIDVDDIITLSQHQAKNIPESDFNKFKRLYELLKNKNSVNTYGVFSKNNELIASCVFSFSHNRAYYILVGNHPNGKTLGASHALIDAFIKDHAGQNLLLDFEGSDISNLAFFYSSFGAKEEKFAAIKMNKLPWYAKWLKK